MKGRFEVLSAAEIKQIDAASMTVLAETGLKVEFNKALQLFKEAGCQVDES